MIVEHQVEPQAVSDDTNPGEDTPRRTAEDWDGQGRAREEEKKRESGREGAVGWLGERERGGEGDREGEIEQEREEESKGGRDKGGSMQTNALATRSGPGSWTTTATTLA